MGKQKFAYRGCGSYNDELNCGSSHGESAAIGMPRHAISYRRNIVVPDCVYGRRITATDSSAFIDKEGDRELIHYSSCVFPLRPADTAA
jgi:hypothetical protein